MNNYVLQTYPSPKMFSSIQLLLVLLYSFHPTTADTTTKCTLSTVGNTCTVTSPAASESASLMTYKRLGNSGLLVSRLSYGAWITFGEQIDDDAAYNIMKLCLDAGINLFDNAEAYNAGLAEEVMGRVFKRLEVDYPIQRSDYVVTTKIFFGTARGHGKHKDRTRWIPNQRGLSRKHIIEGTKASLKRLQMEYVDVVYAHRFDPHTPMEEIVRAFNWIIDQGMAFYWCTSEWSSEQITRAMEVANRLKLIGPICEQPQYNMLHRQRFETEYQPLYNNYNYGTTIWSSLSSGILTGKYNNGIPADSRLGLESADYILKAFLDGSRHKGLSMDDMLAKVQLLGAVAKRLGCTMAQLAIGWTLKNEHVTSVILGATKISQLEDNFGALRVAQDLLSQEVMEEIEIILGNKPSSIQDWNPNPTEL